MTKGRDLMLEMGSDFHYSNAHVWYKNLDKLIHYVNKDGRVNVFYSSPADYVAAKHSYNITWAVKDDDFFPYADTPRSFWTGYFSSRASSKGYIRSATAYLQAARQLEAFVGRNGGDENSGGATTDALEAAVSLCQHHDSITGTARQHVANDYHARIHDGLVEAQRVVVGALAQLITAGRGALGSNSNNSSSSSSRKLTAILTASSSSSSSLSLQPNPNENEDPSPLPPPHHRHEDENDNNYSPVHLEACLWLNISACALTVDLSKFGASIFAVAYNPVAWRRWTAIRVPISTLSTCTWKVSGPDGDLITSQLVPRAPSTTALQQLLAHVNATDSNDAADAELVFSAVLPPLGYSSFIIEPSEEEVSHSNGIEKSCQAVSTLPSPPRQHQLLSTTSIFKQIPTFFTAFFEKKETSVPPIVSITNGLLTVEFDASTGLMTRISSSAAAAAASANANEAQGLSVDISAALRFYNSSDGLDSDEDRGQASGAYIFRPNGDYAVGDTLQQHQQQHEHESLWKFQKRRGLWKSDDDDDDDDDDDGGSSLKGSRNGQRPVSLQVIEGEEVSEVRQVFEDWATLITRYV